MTKNRNFLFAISDVDHPFLYYKHNKTVGRIIGEIDNGWPDDSGIDCAQYTGILRKQFPRTDGL